MNNLHAAIAAKLSTSYRSRNVFCMDRSARGKVTMIDCSIDQMLVLGLTYMISISFLNNILLGCEN